MYDTFSPNYTNYMLWLTFELAKSIVGWTIADVRHLDLANVPGVYDSSCIIVILARVTKRGSGDQIAERWQT